MIGKYAQYKHANKAFELLRSMQLVGFKPNAFTLVSFLPACSHLAALLQLGKEIHG
jgi:pentatricopeptide repeat protein